MACGGTAIFSKAVRISQARDAASAKHQLSLFLVHRPHLSMQEQVTGWILARDGFCKPEGGNLELWNSRGGDAPVCVFSAASCLARKDTAALLMPSASLIPAHHTKCCSCIAM